MAQSEPRIVTQFSGPSIALAALRIIGCVISFDLHHNPDTDLQIVRIQEAELNFRSEFWWLFLQYPKWGREHSLSADHDLPSTGLRAYVCTISHHSPTKKRLSPSHITHEESEFQRG